MIIQLPANGWRPRAYQKPLWYRLAVRIGRRVFVIRLPFSLRRDSRRWAREHK